MIKIETLNNQVLITSLRYLPQSIYINHHTNLLILYQKTS